MSEGREPPRPVFLGGTAGQATLPSIPQEWVLIKKPRCEPGGWVPRPCHGV